MEFGYLPADTRPCLTEEKSTTRLRITRRSLGFYLCLSLAHKILSYHLLLLNIVSDIVNYQLSCNLSYRKDSKQTSSFLASAPPAATTNQNHKLSWVSRWYLFEISETHYQFPPLKTYHAFANDTKHLKACWKYQPCRLQMSFKTIPLISYQQYQDVKYKRINWIATWLLFSH